MSLRLFLCEAQFDLGVKCESNIASIPSLFKLLMRNIARDLINFHSYPTVSRIYINA